MSGAIRALLRVTKHVGTRIAKPLRRGEGPNKFQLSAMDTATTTYDGDDGWAKRPPATLKCPRCGGDIAHQHPFDNIDCPHCVAEFSYWDFPDMELKHLTCPVCRNEMVHGQRHPESLDIVEWATCNGCRYHWEFKHSYS
jgi:hypothetical protein